MVDKCKMDVFPKDKPYFVLHSDDILKQKGFMRLGKIQLVFPKDIKKEVYIVEDQFTATRYEDYDCALEHFEENIKIDEQIRKGD